jgi:hypothetical protein
MDDEQLKHVLERTPNKYHPEDAVRELMIAWLCGISKAVIEEGKPLTREQAGLLLDTIRDDSLQLADAMVERRLDQYRRSPFN